MTTNMMPILLVILRWKYSVGSESSEKAASSLLSMFPLNTSILLTDGVTHDLECMDGLSGIIWTFKNVNEVKPSMVIQTIMGIYDLSHGNRTLTIRNPLVHRNTGYYRCEGTGAMGETLAGEVYVKVVLSATDSSFKKIGWSSTSTRIFERGSAHTLFCVVAVFPSFKPRFMWYHLNNRNCTPLLKEGPLFEGRVRESLIHGFEGSSHIKTISKNRDTLVYNFSLTLSNIRLEGHYLCKVDRGEKSISQSFHIYFRKFDKCSVYVLIGIIAGCFFIVLLTYCLRYHLTIFIKSALSVLLFRDQTLKKYNFFFLYNYDDIDDIRIVQHVVQDLEFQGYSSYFHNRDQMYGEDTFETLISRVATSDMVVIWASTSLFHNPVRSHCVDTVIHHYCSTKRIYVMGVSKKFVVAQCHSKSVEADLNSCMTSKRFLLNSSNILVRSKANIYARWNYYIFLSWLISSLPIRSATKYFYK